jgi:hypothetical protein
MAFARTKEIKGHRYYYWVKSVRSGSRVRQVHIRYIGKNAPAATDGGAAVARAEPSPSRLGRPAAAKEATK